MFCPTDHVIEDDEHKWNIFPNKIFSFAILQWSPPYITTCFNDDITQTDVLKYIGDQTYFHTFIMTFRIEYHTSNNADFLYSLEQHLDGETKQITEDCLHTDPNLGYI